MMRPANASSITGDSNRIKPASASSSTSRACNAARTARALESLRLGAIRNDEPDFGFEIAVQNRVDDGLQIGAAAGNQDAEFDRRIFRHRIARGSADRHSALAARNFADHVGGKFAAAQMSNDAI